MGIPDIVLGRQRLKDGDGEGHPVRRLVCHLLGQGPQLCVVDVFILGILNPDVPTLRVAMRALSPFKGWLYCELDPQNSPAESRA